MNNTTKASLGATVLLLVVALVIAVQNMTELKSVRGQVQDRDAKIALLENQLVHERDMNQKLVIRAQAPAEPAVVQTSPALEERLNALEVELQKKAEEIKAQEEESKMLVNRVQEKEIIREKELTETQRKIRDAASIGEVSHVEDGLGFAVITAGREKGLEPNMQFAIRRDVFIVGKVLVDSVEDANSSIVNIVQGSVQPGLKIRPGDTVIAYPIY